MYFDSFVKNMIVSEHVHMEFEVSTFTVKTKKVKNIVSLFLLLVRNRKFFAFMKKYTVFLLKDKHRTHCSVRKIFRLSLEKKMVWRDVSFQAQFKLILCEGEISQHVKKHLKITRVCHEKSAGELA